MNATKNYMTDGGDKLVIGGTLHVEAGATIEGVNGISAVAAVQAASTATTIADLKADFNALLAKLKTAGLMATE